MFMKTKLKRMRQAAQVPGVDAGVKMFAGNLEGGR